MKNLFFAIFCIPSVSMADSFCDENRLDGNVYSICAHSESGTESHARDLLISSAKHAFDSYCEPSKACRHADIKVIPKRTECVLIKGNPKSWINRDLYKCVSLTAYVID